MQWRLVAALLLTLAAAPALPFDHSHQGFTELLQRHVLEYDQGRKSVVNYGALAATPQPLAQYLDSLSAVTPEHYRQWSEPEQLAFLINAYNGFTLQLIVDNYQQFATGEARSIRDLGSFFSSPWRKSFFTLLGEQRTLDWLEHQKIRVDFNEPRIHAALVCAALSCPKLSAEAFRAKVLSAQLEQQMLSFLTDSDKNYISGTTLYLSKIFDWYKKDFGNIQQYMANYANALTDDPKLQQLLQQQQLTVRYTPYDWHLNSLAHHASEP